MVIMVKRTLSLSPGYKTELEKALKQLGRYKNSRILGALSPTPMQMVEDSVANLIAKLRATPKDERSTVFPLRTPRGVLSFSLEDYMPWSFGEFLKRRKRAENAQMKLNFPEDNVKFEMEFDLGRFEDDWAIFLPFVTLSQQEEDILAGVALMQGAMLTANNKRPIAPRTTGLPPKALFQTKESRP